MNKLKIKVGDCTEISRGNVRDPGDDKNNDDDDVTVSFSFFG